MSTALGHDKFYKNTLPTPRIYTDDVKINEEERVNSPVRCSTLMEPNLNKLQAEPDTFSNKRKHLDAEQIDQIQNVSNVSSSSPFICSTVSSSNMSTPPAPVAIKRTRRVLSLVGDGDEEKKNLESEDCGGSQNRQFPVRKLWDDFNSVANETVKDSKTPVCRRSSSRLVKPKLR